MNFILCIASCASCLQAIPIVSTLGEELRLAAQRLRKRCVASAVAREVAAAPHNSGGGAAAGPGPTHAHTRGVAGPTGSVLEESDVTMLADGLVSVTLFCLLGHVPTRRRDPSAGAPASLPLPPVPSDEQPAGALDFMDRRERRRFG